MTIKRIAILGATGSIGRQALEVVRENPDRFEVCLLTCQNNVALLIEQALAFRPKAVVVANEIHYLQLKEALSGTGIRVSAGEGALQEAVQHEDVDLVLSALVGFAGLLPTMAAIKSGKDIALANKETLVVAGALVMDQVAQYGVNLLPVDSEHSAIFQCLVGEYAPQVEKIYLTASGGPFLGRDRDSLATVRAAQALKHPNWDMGAKITIDSASLMNKGLEVIEAKWLFGLESGQIDVLVHPQSIVHSMVQFVDGSIKAQLGLPDMKLPIQYALAYPERIHNEFERLDFMKHKGLTFDAPDRQTFRNLDLAYAALAAGGNLTCVLNAANEEVVAAFLKDEIGFLEMSNVIEAVMDEMPFIDSPSLDQLVETDKLSRAKTIAKITEKKKVYHV